MISIIIPIYNAEKSLAICIDSVLKQTYKNFELILVNDGSKDSSGAICKRYATSDSRIVYIEKGNAGVGAARNVGIEVAKGEWICFIDSDDEVTPDYLEAFDLDHNTADLTISGIDFINCATGDSFRKIKYGNRFIHLPENKRALIDILFSGYPFAKAFRRDLIGNLRFPTDIMFHEDHVFIFEYLRKVINIQLVDKATYLYKIDYSSNSLSKKRHSWDALNKSSEYLFDSLKKIIDMYSYSKNDLKEVYSFCYEPKISAIYSLYETKTRYSDRIDTLRKILFGERCMTNYYFPEKRKGKLIKNVVTHLPLPIIDLFFKLVNLYQSRPK
jgi:glycosyltransferase, family 2